MAAGTKAPSWVKDGYRLIAFPLPPGLKAQASYYLTKEAGGPVIWSPGFGTIPNHRDAREAATKRIPKEVRTNALWRADNVQIEDPGPPILYIARTWNRTTVGGAVTAVTQGESIPILR